MNPASSHHLVAYLAIAGGVLIAILLLLALRKRTPKQAPQADDLQVKLEERLATGRFSRAPSNWRRKIVVDPNEDVVAGKPADQKAPEKSSSPGLRIHTVAEPEKEVIDYFQLPESMRTPKEPETDELPHQDEGKHGIL